MSFLYQFIKERCFLIPVSVVQILLVVGTGTVGKGVFEGLKPFVDIGSGTGTVTKAIADTFPDIECTVFDLPHVVADFQGSKNLKYVGGDMFEAVPPADAVFMKVKYILVLFPPGT